MKIQGCIPRRATMKALLLFSTFVIGAGSPAAWASPPKKREHVPQPLEKIGNFFFNLARKLEQSGFPDGDRDVEIIYDARRADPLRVEVTPREVYPPGVTVRPGDRGTYDVPPPTARLYPRGEPLTPPGYRPYGYQPYDEPFTPPNFQPHPQPNLEYPNNSRPNGRSGLSIPVQPEAPSDGSGALRQPIAPGTSSPFEPPAKSKSSTSPGNDAGKTSRPAPNAATTDGGPAFATRVPGHPGFVYPPGVEQDLKNMIDVRDFAPGQKVKDPRTGQIFLVPPK